MNMNDKQGKILANTEVELLLLQNKMTILAY